MPPPVRFLDCTPIRLPAAMPFKPAWRSETALALARGIVAEAALDRMPILADALEEAGCDDPLVLRHCRECPHHHPHCWVLGDLLGTAPVAELSRMTDAEVRREVERVTGRPVLRPSESPWSGPSPARVRVVRAVPVIALAAVLVWFAWANLSPPLTGSQVVVPVATLPKVNAPAPSR